MNSERLRIESLGRTRAERVLDRYLIKDLKLPPVTKRQKVTEQTEVRPIQMSPAGALAKLMRHISSPGKTEKCVKTLTKLISAHSESFTEHDFKAVIAKVIEIDWTFSIINDLYCLVDSVSNGCSLKDWDDLAEVRYYLEALRCLDTDDTYDFHKQIGQLTQKLTVLPCIEGPTPLTNSLFVKAIQVAAIGSEWKKSAIRLLSISAYKSQSKFSRPDIETISALIDRLSTKNTTLPLEIDPLKPTQSVSDGGTEAVIVNGLDSWSMRQFGLNPNKY